MKFKFSAACKQVFKIIKNAITPDRVLMHFNPKLPLVLAADAFPYSISAILSHVILDNIELVLFQEL